MKTIITFFFAMLLSACSADQIPLPKTESANNTQRPSANNPKNNVLPNQVALLKIDFETLAFEGGKVLTFSTSDSFTIASEYQAPGDFGGITLRYQETGQMLFSGTIHWMGLGQMSYPENLQAPGSFQQLPNPLPMPHLTSFQNVAYTEFAYYPHPMPYGMIWEAIDNLQLVAQFRASNPGAGIHVFLYTPSVGVGNPADWDYFILLKN